MHAMQKFQMLGSYMEDLTKPRHNFIGYDFKYGSDFVRNCSCANFSVVNLIKEIRDNSLFVYGFHHNMLNKIVCTVSCE